MIGYFHLAPHEEWHFLYFLMGYLLTYKLGLIVITLSQTHLAEVMLVNSTCYRWSVVQ